MLEIRDFLRFTRAYLLANPVGKKHHANMGQRIARFVAWANANHAAELTPETVNRFLASLEDLSPHTVNGYRANIMAVWADALGTRVIWKIRRAKTPRELRRELSSFSGVRLVAALRLPRVGDMNCWEIRGRSLSKATACQRLCSMYRLSRQALGPFDMPQLPNYEPLIVLTLVLAVLYGIGWGLWWLGRWVIGW